MTPNTLEICLDKRTGQSFFDEIIVGRFTRISFHRTLRIPEDGRDYPLPAGLGRFPIHRVEDYADKVPVNWLQSGGFFIPVYQKEALFLQLEGPQWHPTIAKICVGKVNAITGKPYSEELSKNHQDYVVIPNQKWLDGICSSEGLVKQFVAMPLGQGYTIEAQITDEERYGGFQIVSYGCVPGRFPDRDPDLDARIYRQEYAKRCLFSSPSFYPEDKIEMGIAAGGSIKQQIQKDIYGIESWNQNSNRSIIVHLVNSIAYKAITGHEPPATPITVAEYQKAKIPWYSHYDETVPAVKSPSLFKRILGVSAIDRKRGTSKHDEASKRRFLIENIHQIMTPDKKLAADLFRQRANESNLNSKWSIALTEINYVIDLDEDALADDYALRSCCNFYLTNYKEGIIDASIALDKDSKCVRALLWRAYCRVSTDDHYGVREDAERLLEFPETELIGLHLKAENSLATGKYKEAIIEASLLAEKQPEHSRARNIIDEAQSMISNESNRDSFL